MDPIIVMVEGYVMTLVFAGKTDKVHGRSGREQCLTYEFQPPGLLFNLFPTRNLPSTIPIVTCGTLQYTLSLLPI